MASFASPPPAATTSLLPAFNLSVDSPSAASSARSPSHRQSISPAPPAAGISSAADSTTEQPRAAPSPVVPTAEESPATAQRADEQDAFLNDEDQPMVEDGDLDADALSLGAAAPSAAAVEPSAVDKGKGVLRDEAPSLSKEEQDKLDEAERQKIIEKVLKRSEVVKTTRNFMNRLALAAFKAQRGWQDVALDIIEPHLEQEALKRKEQEQHSSEAYQSQQHQQVYQDPTPPPPLAFVPPPPNASVMRNGPGLLYDQNQYQQQMQQSGYVSTAFASYPPGGSTFSLDPPTQEPRPPKRRHMEEPNGHAEPSPPIPRPPPSSSSNAQGRPQPRTNGSGGRPVNGANGPLSTSDPGFSSFVDAAAALTGLSRVPSDPSAHSGEEGEDAPPRAAGQERPQPNGNGEAVERPRTPEGRAKGLLERTGAGGTGGESSAEGAAELMLFLAASPSPVQVRTGAVRPALGEGMEGMGMKGRRLFSGAVGAGGDDFSAPPTQSSSVQTVFGDHLSGHSPNPPSHSGLAASPYTEESNLDPSKSSHHYSTSASSHQPPPPPPGGVNSASALGNGLPPVPGTPTRDRQPSGSNWESYLNVSPSPQRATVDRSEAAVAARQAERGPPPVFGMPMTSLPPTSLPLGRNGGAQGEGESGRW
ncbi:hypothetical protein BCR35DRAFT_324752 [Leucosporidium creatinivorum]|uniref:Uncharacterized protein n=1 Tax=Leucosporidium creatinivorum TaxID=106004 RepID=A0A1Y2FL41_9BASI|nr:hypothetical protein BCR35DRAFT_324752 [Leucosporidium creatinivorum]